MVALKLLTKSLSQAQAERELWGGGGDSSLVPGLLKL
jgi:hypothetical protein